MAGNPARKWWALVAIAASVLVVGLDLTVLNLALPTIATDLHASTSDLQWISDSYSLVLAAAMLPAGLLGDRLGRKKVLLAALVLFGASSAVCAYASGTGELIAGRAVLGIGAAAIFPLSLSVIPVLFAPEERQRAIALMASATFISFPIGPIVGGYLLDHFWWGSVFLLNVPVVVLAVIAVTVLLPESRSAERPRIDAVGGLVSSAGLAALTYGFIKAGQDGWTDAVALGTIAAGAAVLAGLVAWERWLTGRNRAGSGGSLRGGVIRPLIELRLFRSAGFTWGTTLSTLISFAMFGIFFAMPQYFQEVRGADAMGSGLRLLPMIGGMVIGMIGSTRLASPRQAADGTPGPRRASGKGRARVGSPSMPAPPGSAPPRLAAGQREGPGRGRLRDHGGHPRVRRHHHGQQRDRIRRRLVRGVRPRPGAGHAADDERGTERPVRRDQRLGLGPDLGPAAGGRHHRGRRPGHRAQLGVPQPPRRDRPARRGRIGRQEQRRGRRRDRPQGRFGAVARLGAARVRHRDGHHALGLRRDRAGQRHPGGHLPAAADRRRGPDR